MNVAETLNEIIGALDPDTIEAQFVVSAKIITADGVMQIVSAEEWCVIRDAPERYGIVDGSVTLNLGRVRRAILNMVNACYARAKFRKRL